MTADCHIHMVLDGVHWRDAIRRHEQKPDESHIRIVLAIYKASGYTYLRDGGDRWGVGAMARSLAPEYGITYRTPLAPLCLEGHYGAFIGETYRTPAEYAALVVQHRQEGADFIKIMISGLMDFNHFGVLTQPGYDPALIRELIHIAHEEGMSVMAHANGARTVEAAAAAGVDSVEHGAYLDADALQAMAAAGTVWVPTISTVANLRGQGRYNEQALWAIFRDTGLNIADFAAMGGQIACGSDAGAWAVPHCCNTEDSHLRYCLGPQADAILAAGLQKIREKF